MVRLSLACSAFAYVTTLLILTVPTHSFPVQRGFFNNLFGSESAAATATPEASLAAPGANDTVASPGPYASLMPSVSVTASVAPEVPGESPEMATAPTSSASVVATSPSPSAIVEDTTLEIAPQEDPDPQPSVSPESVVVQQNSTAGGVIGVGANGGAAGSSAVGGVSLLAMAGIVVAILGMLCVVIG